MKIVSFATMLLAGCVATSEVFPVADDAYQVTSDTHGPGLATARNAVQKSATEFCFKQSGTVEVIKFDDHTGLNSGASTLTFRCSKSAAQH